MRVLATTVPGWGHLVPMLGVLRALQHAGHDVQVATHRSFHPHVAGLGFDTVSAGLAESEMLDERVRRWPDTIDQPPSMWAAKMFLEIAAPSMAADLAAVTGGQLPDLVIAEEGEYGGPAFAASVNVPIVRHGWGSPWAQSSSSTTALAYIDPCPSSLNPSVPNSEGRWGVRLETPLLVRADRELSEWLAERVRSLALVSFGTVPLYAAAPRLLQRTVDALVGLGLDVLATTDVLAHEPSSDRVRLERMVELPDVLPHCTVVVCHGGAGTVLAALKHARPLIIIPRGAPSQQRMAQACARRGVARIVTDPSDLPDIALRILDGDLARQAQAVAREIAAAPGPDDIVRRLEEHGR